MVTLQKLPKKKIGDMEPVCAECTVMMTQVGVIGPISLLNAFKGVESWRLAPSAPFFLLLGDDSFVL